MAVLLLVTALSMVVQSRSVEEIVLPLNLPASEYWDGNDGWWSSFFVQIGNPEQTLRLLPGTSASAGDSIWAVVDEGCTVANPNMSSCADKRGDTFDRNNSTSWSTERLENGGLYSLTTVEEAPLGLNGNAYYGFDTINLGLLDSGVPSLKHQVIAGFGTNDFWIGSLGLSPLPFNFTNFNDPQPSMLGTLYNQSLIPSLSWAYTAGAHYLDSPAFGSLTLGGYDTTRFKPNNVTFAFGADISRDLLVSLESIRYDTIGSPLLLSREISIFVDSMVTQMWLPDEVCQRFEQAFNLTWNATTELYILDEDTHDALLDQNPTFIFTLIDSNDNTVEIAFPYAAFDLNYTLGRVFLQGAYVIADYGRQNFSISQALFPSTDVSKNLVSIWPPGHESKSNGKEELSSGAIAGIVVGAILILAFVTGITICVKRRSKETAVLAGHQPYRHDEEAESGVQYKAQLDDRDTMILELECPKPELETQDGTCGRHELAAPSEVHELEGNDILDVGRGVRGARMGCVDTRSA